MGWDRGSSHAFVSPRPDPAPVTPPAAWAPATPTPDTAPARRGWRGTSATGQLRGTGTGMGPRPLSRLGSVQGRNLCCCWASLLPQPLNTAPCGGGCDGNRVGSLLMEAGEAGGCIPLDWWDWADLELPPLCPPQRHCGPLVLPYVSSPYPGASLDGLTCSPTTPPAAPAVSATATPLSARQRLATR